MLARSLNITGRVFGNFYGADTLRLLFLTDLRHYKYDRRLLRFFNLPALIKATKVVFVTWFSFIELILTELLALPAVVYPFFDTLRYFVNRLLGFREDVYRIGSVGTLFLVPSASPYLKQRYFYVEDNKGDLDHLRRFSRYILYERVLRALSRLIDFVGSLVLLAVGPQYLVSSARVNQVVKRVTINSNDFGGEALTLSYRHFLITVLAHVSIGLLLTMPGFSYFNHVFSNPYFWWVDLASLVLAYNVVRGRIAFGGRTSSRGVLSR